MGWGKKRNVCFSAAYKCLYEGSEEMMITVSATLRKRNPNVLPEGKEKYP